jgi:FkbM family methyltransferase
MCILCMIKKIIDLLFRKNFFQWFLIIVNIWLFVIIKFFYRIFTAKNNLTKHIYWLYFKKIPLSCKLYSKKINYFFQLNTLLAIYESEEFLNEILDESYECYIDIGANVWRLWFFVASYNKEVKKIYMLEPNHQSFKFILNRIKDLKIGDMNNFCTINKWIWLREGKAEMFILKYDELNTMSTIKFDEDIYWDRCNYNKTLVEITSFKDFFENYWCNQYDSFIIKIDVEWFELEVLESFFNFFNTYNKRIRIKILIEVREKNENEFLSYIKNLWGKIEKLRKIWFDYLLILENK